MSKHITRLSDSSLVRELKRAENMLLQVEESKGFKESRPKMLMLHEDLQERIALLEAECERRGIEPEEKIA